MPLTPGATLGRYEVQALLGAGGMGEVYSAYDTRLRRRVALKVLKRQESSTDAADWTAAVARMMREARAAAALSHPNVVAIHDVDEVEGQLTIAMECIEGRSLRDLVDGEDPLDTRVRWLVDVARALAAAHKAGLVHRDIKPENVMVRTDGIVKVLDFGIARSAAAMADPSAATAEDAMGTLTGKGVIVGTPMYMAPEQLRGEEIDGRTDQFAWGVLAFELLARRTPHGAGRDAIGIVAAILSEPAPRLEGVPGVVATTIARALEKRREDRFGSMDEIAQTLEPSASNGLPRSVVVSPSASPSAATTAAPVVAPTSRPRLRRVWLLASAVLVAGVALVAWKARDAMRGSSPSASSSPAPRPTAVTDLPPPKSSNPLALAAYRRGLQGFRDGTWSTAHSNFLEAERLDPELVAAHLRLAISGIYVSAQFAHQEFEKAFQQRTELDARDQALLDAIAALHTDPPDTLEVVRRLGVASATYPGDAELYVLASGFVRDTGPSRSLALAEKGVELDPLYADGWQSRGYALATAGRFEEAVASFDRCLLVAPHAADCLWDRLSVHATAGKCDRALLDARSYVAALPQKPFAYTFLAALQLDLDGHTAAARATLDRAGSLAPADDSTRLARAQLDIISGHFVEAEDGLRQMLRDVEKSPNEATHSAPALLLHDLLVETDRQDAAADVAEDLLNRRVALVRPTTPNALGSYEPTLLATLRRTGRITPAAYDKRVAAWLAEQERFVMPDGRWILWEVAFAAPAVTREEAALAMAELPKFGPVRGTTHGPSDLQIRALTFARGADAARALPIVRSATSTCGQMLAVFPSTRVHFELGRILEEQKDGDGACKAYRVVLDRWGKAKPAAVTAELAGSRARELGCQVKDP